MASVQSIIILFYFDNSVIMYLILQSLVEPRVPVCGLKMLSSGCVVVHCLRGPQILQFQDDPVCGTNVTVPTWSTLLL